MSSIARRLSPGLTQVVEDAIDSFRTLGKRSMLALLGIVMGSGSIVAVTNIGHNAGQEVAKIFQDMGVDTLVANFSNDQGLEESRLSIDVEKIRGLDFSELMLTPVAQTLRIVSFNDQSFDAKVVGAQPALSEVIKLAVDKGRFIHFFDHEDNVVVLGHKVAASLSNGAATVQVGDWIKIGNYLFRVVGVLQPVKESMVNPVFANDSVFMPLQSLARVDSAASIADVIIRIAPGQNIELVAAQVFERLSHAFKTRTVTMIVPQQIMKAMSLQNRTFNYLLMALGVITLVGGGVAVMNIMYMNVSERRTEIGLRMAIGARRQDIRNLFLFEALTLSALGAVLGAALGILLAWLYSMISDWAFELALVSVPLGITSTLLVGVFFGLQPALAASRLTPAEALRDY